MVAAFGRRKHHFGRWRAGGRRDRSGDGLIDRFAACFRDVRREELIEHRVKTLFGQRVFGLAQGYEDLIDHDDFGTTR